VTNTKSPKEKKEEKEEKMTGEKLIQTLENI
jgi:hypothetical protein